MSSLSAHTDAIVTLLRAGGSKAYGVGELATITRPSHYNEVHVMERTPEVLRVDGTSSIRLYRVLIRSVGELYDDAQREREIAGDALVGAYVTVSGRTSTVISRALSDDPLGPDDNWFSGVTELSYAI